MIARSIHGLDECDADAWISSVGDQRGTGGGTPGEHPFRARCSPSGVPDFTRIVVDANALRYVTASVNFNQRCELLDAWDERRSVPPAKGDDAGEAVNSSTVA